MTTRIKLRRDTAANWTANNPILALGEPGLDTDNNAVKYGDGVTTWNNLPYSGEGATENIWLAVGSDCNSGKVKVSTDGVKWTESFSPMPRGSNFGWQNFWWAKPLGGKVIYDMYVDYLGTETLGWSDNALDYPNPVTFTNLPTTDVVDTYDWWDVFYVNGKYIAVGGYFEVGSTDVERPMFATSDDGKTWTYGAIDDAFTSGLVDEADANPTGIRITSVAYNGVGYLFALEWDLRYGGSNIGSLPPGFFYVTSLSATLDATNHINPSIDNNAGLKGLVWNHDHWAAYGHQNVWNRASLFINTNVNPATGNWTEISLNSTASNGPQKSVFGTYPDFGNTLAAFTTGKIGDYYWDVMALNNGRVMATKDKGVTWIGSVPFNLYSNIDTVIWDGTDTKITFDVPGFDGGDYAPTVGERVDIRYGNVPQLRGFFYLGTETASDGTSRTWTIYSDRALTQHVNSNTWAENYDTSNNNGYAVVTFSRDSDGYDPLTYGGFDQVKIADGKIVAINGAAWACSTDLLQWQLSLNTDVFTSGSYGTSSLEYGTAGSTNRSSLTYVSDTNYVTEVAKEEFLGPNPPKSYTWAFDAMGNYVNQLALAENFKVSIGSGLGISDGFATPMTMGMEPTGKWWIGHDNWDGTNFGTYTPTSIGAEDWDAPGFEDVVIRTDGGDNQWVFNRNGETKFPNYTFPSAHGTANQVLKDDGNGSLTWTEAGLVSSEAPNTRTGTAKTLTFGTTNGGQVAITGPMAASDTHSAERLVIAGRDSYFDGNTSSYLGEGGDLYLWAGKGADGGDIKIDAGDGLATSNSGGTIKIRAGNNTNTNGVGGYVAIEAGAGGEGGSHGDVVIRTGPSTVNHWTFGANGDLSVAGNITRAGGLSAVFKAGGNGLAMSGGGTVPVTHFTIRTVNNNDGTYALTFASATPTDYSWSGFGMDMTNGTPINVWGAKFTATQAQDYTIATFETVGDTFQVILTDYSVGIYRITAVLVSTTSSSISIEQIA